MAGLDEKVVTARALRSDRRRSEALEKAPTKSAAPKKEMKSLARRAARPLESSVVTRKRRRPKARAMAGSASSSEPPVCETPRDATGDLAEPRAAATDSLPVTTPTPTPTAAPREKDGASPTRVFLAPVEDAPHSEHALCFLLDHLAREGDVVHLLVVVPATHPSSALAYGGPMVPRVSPTASKVSRQLRPRFVFTRNVARKCFTFPDWFLTTLGSSFAPPPVDESTTNLPPFLATRPWPPPAMATPGMAFFEQIEIDERNRRRADARNAEAFCKRRFLPIFNRTRFKTDAVVRFVLDVRRSNLDTWSVGEVICDHAERLGATAIVMAPHGRGRLREWFVGSACRHCLRRSKVALVIARPDYESTRAEEDEEDAL
jgi:nucleotide-binding universal stress UspA family protein